MTIFFVFFYLIFEKRSLPRDNEPQIWHSIFYHNLWGRQIHNNNVGLYALTTYLGKSLHCSWPFNWTWATASGDHLMWTILQCSTLSVLFSFIRANLEKYHNSVSVQSRLYLQDHIPGIFCPASKTGASNWKVCPFLLRWPSRCTHRNRCQCTRRSSSSAFQGWTDQSHPWQNSTLPR